MYIYNCINILHYVSLFFNNGNVEIADHALFHRFPLSLIPSLINSDSDFEPPDKKIWRPASSSSSNSDLALEQNYEPLDEVDGYTVVHLAVDFKSRKPKPNTAGYAIMWGSPHEMNASYPLRANNLTSPKAQLTGNYLLNWTTNC